MKQLVIFSFILSSVQICAQTLDFGIELRTNSNWLSNRITGIAVPKHENSELSSFSLPTSNVAFVDDNGQNTFVRFDQVEISNNIDIPLSVRYVMKNDLYFDFKISAGKYKIDYQGSMFKDADYYESEYGNFEDYKASFEGNLIGEPVDGDSSNTYTDEQAYINWFDNQISSDFTSTVSASFVEEVKFRSFQIWIGKQFLEHKRIQPFATGGFHFRTAIPSFQRKHFSIDEPTIKGDLSEITDGIPKFSRSMFGFGLRTGFHIYRYHFAVAAEYSFNLNSNSAGSGAVIAFQNSGAGFRTLSMAIGIDLFSHNMRTINNKNQIYNEEFNNLASTLDKNRAWTLNLNVKAPIHSSMTSASGFSLITIKDVPDPAAGVINLDWQSLSFGSIDRVNWTPRIEVGFRYNIIEKFDLDVAAGFSKVDIDTRVQEVNALLVNNSLTGEYSYGSLSTSANYAVYRSTFVPLYLGGNLYAKVLSKDAFDIRVFGGAAINLLAHIAPNAKSELGVNGSASGIYQTTEDVLALAETDPGSIENIDNSYYSFYSGKVDFDQSAQVLLDDHEGKQGLRSAGVLQTTIFPTVNVGAEVEFNRFLCGISGELTLGSVDNFLIGSYSNVSLNFGYILLSKNRLNKKLRD